MHPLDIPLRNLWLLEGARVPWVTDGWPHELGPGWFRVGELPDRAVILYAAAPLHLVLRFWFNVLHCGWAPLALACWLGFLDVREGRRYSEGRWTWRFWRVHQRYRLGLLGRPVSWRVYLRSWLRTHPWEYPVVR